MPRAVLRTAERIVDDVRRHGDAALFRAIRRYDGVRLTPRTLRVRPGAMRAAWGRLREAERRALRRSWANILGFQRRQSGGAFVQRSGSGTFRFVVRPLERVGLHVPAASGPLVSTLLMCAGAARAAGVRDLALMSPPGDRGGIHPAVLAGAWLAGIREAYAMGGAQGVAAMVYGTRTVRPVDKVLGPGNAWTQAAMILAQGSGRLDGPSEIVVLADGTAPAAGVAPALIPQAEHPGD
ncbi:MAG: histidinol dehydrogenase, partial [bacterium]